MGGEWVDMDVHYGMKQECEQYGIPLERPNHNSAWNFHLPGHRVISRCVVSSKDEQDYIRVINVLNQDLSRILFTDGYNLEDVEYMDVSFVEYLEKRLQCPRFTFMHDYLLAEAFRVTGTDCEKFSALNVLHELTGFGDLEQRCNNHPRKGDPFRKKDLARLGCGGTSALCEAIAADVRSLGGVIRMSAPVGSIICEETAKDPPLRWCAMCAVYTHPFCSLHGPRVRVVDGLGVVWRARSCIVAVPVNCLPCIKFVPPLPDCLSHAAEVANIGDSVKTWGVVTEVGWDVDEVLTWSDIVHSYVKDRGLPVDMLQRFADPEAAEDPAAPSHLLNRAAAIRVNDESPVNPNFLVTDAKSKLQDVKSVHILCMHALKESFPPANSSTQAEYIACAEPLLRKFHHPTLRLHRVLAFDWKTDRWAKGSAMALRTGGGRLIATASAAARQPWEHTRNLFVAGSDLVVGWSGWMEGAVQSGYEAFAAIEKFMFPTLPEGRWYKKIHAKDDDRRGAKHEHL